MPSLQPSTRTVGVLGVGAMGAPMARQLLDGGYEVWLHSRRLSSADSLMAAGARWATTPAELARRSEVVLVALPRLEDLEELWDGDDGILAGAGEHPRAIVLTSTCSPEGVRAMHEMLARRAPEIDFVDAPLSGGVEGARTGRLVIMVGHDGPLGAPLAQLLGTLGTVAELGPVGAGQVAKACNQMIVSAAAWSIAEASVIAERAGISLARLLPLLNGGYAGSAVLSAKLDKFIAKDYAPDGKAAYMVKDLGFAHREARNSGVHAPLLDLLLGQYLHLVEAGLGEEDLAVTLKYVESTSDAR